MTVSQFWRDRPHYTPIEISYIACGLEPQAARETLNNSPAAVVNFYRVMRIGLMEEGKIAPDENFRDILFYKKDAIEMIDKFGTPGQSNFLKEQPVLSPFTENERDKLLKQIGLLALVLAEKSSRYKRGEKPNANQITTDAQSIIDATELPGKKGTGSSELRNSISKGLKLLRDD